MLYPAVVKELVVLPNVGLVVSLYFVQDCRSAPAIEISHVSHYYVTIESRMIAKVR